MRVLTPETRVGLLTIFAGVALLYLSLATIGVDIFGGKPLMRFVINFPSVSGVEEQSKVRLSGVEIGYVESIGLGDGYAMVVVRLTTDANIRKDSIAMIRTAGLLGERFIAIEQGSPGSPLLEDGDELINVKLPADLSDLASDVQSMIRENREDLRKIIQNISVITKDFAQSAPKLTASLQATIDSIKELIKANRANFDATVQNAQELTGELKHILVENRENFRTTVSNAKALTDKLNGILAENRDGLKTTVTNISSASGKVEGLIDSLTEASDSMKAIMAKISNGEGTVGKLVTDEEVYDNLNDTLKGAKGMLNKVGDIGFYLGLRAERAVEWNESRAYLTLKIQPRLDSYYLLEISGDSRAPDSKDGSNNNAFSNILYTVMVAKRFSDITLRGGVIESSAGVAVDYHMLGDRLVLTTELFNLSGYDSAAPDPQVRAFAKWNFMKYLYVYAGGDELFNDEYRTFLVGGGLMFDDDTLKLALGLSRF